jgi:hypothetical protein
MKVIFRINRDLLDAVHHDLSRPHAFALERVGFITCRSGSLTKGTALLAQTYQPVADDDYEDGYGIGAMMSAAAIRKALQFAYNNPVSMVHVHRHEHRGKPGFSHVDLTESAKFIPDFWKVRPGVIHGILVLSHDAMTGLAWNPQTKTPQPFQELAVIGRPLSTTHNEDA